MSRKNVLAGLGLTLGALACTACGGSSAAPSGPVATVSPTPTPTPTPVPKALSVIPPCALPASNPGPSANCAKPQQKLGAAVYAAIDRVLAERGELVDPNDVNGGPRVLNYEAYMTAVVAALGEAGLCGKVDAEGEIGVKTSNSFNEQWIVVSRAGWGTPTENWVIRKYVGACSPATF